LTTGFTVAVPVMASPEVQLEYFAGLMVHRPLYTFVNYYQWRRKHAQKAVVKAMALPDVSEKSRVQEGRNMLSRSRWHHQVCWIAGRLVQTSVSWMFDKDRIRSFFDASFMDDCVKLHGKGPLHGVISVILFEDVEGGVFRLVRKISRLFDVNGRGMVSKISQPQTSFAQIQSMLMSDLLVRYPMSEIIFVPGKGHLDSIVQVIEGDDLIYSVTLHDYLRWGRFCFDRFGLVPSSLALRNAEFAQPATLFSVNVTSWEDHLSSKERELT